MSNFHTLYIDDETDDEVVTFYVGDIEIGSANHDMHGWAGMEAAEEAVKEFARVAGYDIQLGHPRDY